MKKNLPTLISLVLLSSFCISFTQAKPITYEIDSSHTFPAFEADHMGGLSLWRGKINSTSGEIVLDKDKETGSVNVIMDMSTIDFGHEGMNKHAKNSDMFDVEKYPEAVYKGNLTDFIDGAPTKVKGSLTLHGVTKPVDLDIKSFKCRLHPFKLKQVCGADAYGNIMRDDFGVDYAKRLGFKMEVALRIGVEAIKK
ncbi:MAG: YceI family protein [Pseudomonadales bacterium]|nr:YceI family protein [Pseudomonadales bacterium]|tara:strand:- start:174 stop:761 length:588 start_codon:yes stop_codon:yes gene_type:complete